MDRLNMNKYDIYLHLMFMSIYLYLSIQLYIAYQNIRYHCWFDINIFECFPVYGHLSLFSRLFDSVNLAQSRFLRIFSFVEGECPTYTLLKKLRSLFFFRYFFPNLAGKGRDHSTFFTYLSSITEGVFLWKYLSLLALTPQNGRTQSNNLLAKADGLKR